MLVVFEKHIYSSVKCYFLLNLGKMTRYISATVYHESECVNVVF